VRLDVDWRDAVELGVPRAETAERLQVLAPARLQREIERVVLVDGERTVARLVVADHAVRKDLVRVVAIELEAIRPALLRHVAQRGT
jgi:hypothetical protein